MPMNIIGVLFILCAVLMSFIGILLHYLEQYLPLLITRTYRYGKFSATGYQPIVARAEVPKKWFKHFYMFAAPTSVCLFYLVVCRYLWKVEAPKSVIWILDMCLGSSRQPLVSSENTFLAVMLLTFHCCKRFYETHFISIFSNKMMNILHYLVGFYHYLGIFICVIGESQGFVENSEVDFSWARITYFQLLCAAIFLLSSCAQLQTNFILSNLRKNKDGKVISTAYKIPHGGLFEYISGALQFTEIITYLILSIILWKNTTFHYVTAWVVSNQIFTAILTHEWYVQTFQNYPKTRKIIIPYVY